MKHLKFHKIQAVERRGALMLVWFLDDEGNMYDWAPKWDDVEKIFLKQINVERFNKPESEWLNKFAKTAKEVVEGAQRIESAYKVYGHFRKFTEGKLLIVTGNDFNYLVPGFEVTLDFLDEWLLENVEAYMINDIAIRLRLLTAYGQVLKEYPPAQEDIPF